MRSHIHTFFDGTRIDVAATLGVSRPRVVDPDNRPGNQSVEFAITYKGLEHRSLFRYSVKELVDSGVLGHALYEAWWTGVDDIGQMTADALDRKIDELVSDWSDFRTNEVARQSR
ncbi:hypothetical protein HFO56_01730 [Rhizobium laguerreae]|uniref:hypothetical protein n=1 Tax=Rhizobium laguerreae TaxID=1076926 RepID=UPI001C8FD138|nr:hypothetical protein [Rhizobium laguerreae]MBY3151131.1 hypothetical protein [Rhizobium laguerreae]